MAASTESMCARRDWLRVYSCMRERASSREGSTGTRVEVNDEYFVPGTHVQGTRLDVADAPDSMPVPMDLPDHFLREIRVRPGEHDEARFPFSVPTIRALDVLRTDAPVTFFVGE